MHETSQEAFAGDATVEEIVAVTIADALANSLSTSIVPIGSGRRPILLDRLIEKALRAVDVDVSEEAIHDIKRAIAFRFLTVLGNTEGYPKELDDLRRRVAEAEEREAQVSGELPLKSILEIKTLISYGLTVQEAARIFGVSETHVRQIVDGTALVRIVGQGPVKTKTKTKTGRPRRAFAT